MKTIQEWFELIHKDDDVESANRFLDDIINSMDGLEVTGKTLMIVIAFMGGIRMEQLSK